MKKIYLPLILLLISVNSYAQINIDDISKCVIAKENPADSVACFQKYLLTSISISNLVGNWVFTNGIGIKSDATERNIIIYNVDKPFSSGPGGCDTIIAFGKQNAVQSKACAPDPNNDELVARIQSIALYTYQLTGAGVVQLNQTDKDKDQVNTASCSLIKVTGSQYLLCETTDQDNVKSVLSYKKAS